MYSFTCLGHSESVCLPISFVQVGIYTLHVCSGQIMHNTIAVTAVFSDPDSIFQARLCCGKMLLSMDPNPPADTVMGMLQSGHILMALSTLMFAPVPLEQVSRSQHITWKIETIPIASLLV